MNEFEWLRQTRALRDPVMPERDLWAGIEARLMQTGQDKTAPAPARQASPRRHTPWLLAASIAAVSVLAGAVVWQQHQAVEAPLASSTPDARWRPADPRLAGAAVVLDAASMELRQAMEQNPDSPALQRLLQRTLKQQSQLRQMEHQAG